MIKLNSVMKSVLIFKKHIGVCIVAYALIFLSTQSGFADLTIPISGKVKSHTNGVYTVQTDKFLIKIKDAKLTLELKRTLSRRIGRQVEITVPYYAIVSHKQLTSSKSKKRTPAKTSDTDTSTSDSKNNKTNK